MFKAMTRNLALAAIMSAAVNANAGPYEFRIDSFSIARDGSPFFIDNFSDGAPPPSAPNLVSGNPQSYTTVGTLGPENAGGNGRLILNKTGAVVVPNAIGPGSSFIQAATLNTNTQNVTTGGLKRNHTFTVTGLFDLLPTAGNERYGIRLTDQASVVRDDQLDLRVTNIGGIQMVEFRNGNPTTDASISAFLPLDTTHEQIALFLDHPVANTDTIFAGFQYFDAGIAFGSPLIFAQTADIFSGEIFTQARFNAIEGIRDAAAVPEPPTSALTLACLALLGSVLRRPREMRP
jgi:hypothetical protein